LQGIQAHMQVKEHHIRTFTRCAIS